MFRGLSIPTPFQIGSVNAYLAGRTIVDPGPDSDAAWAKLLEALETEELVPADLERVLITHPHPDHFGMASRLRDEGAEVYASPAAAEVVDNFEGRLAYEQSYFTDFFERCGLARDTAQTVTELPEAFLPYAPDVTVDEIVTAGEELLVADERVIVDSLAGHAPGELLFGYSAGGERRAIVGDNVLADITPNPFLQPPPEPGDDRPRVLPAYNDSLDRLRKEPYERFLTGHREPVTNPAERIDEIRSAHEERTETVADLVDGPTTPADLVDDLFEDLPATELFAGMSEAVGHLDVLEARGEVERTEKGGLFVYEPV